VKAVPVSDVFSSVEELDAYLDRIQRKMVEGGEEEA
jgi:sigma-B regulation protein RsbU (phosphoserine phosphatase)